MGETGVGLSKIKKQFQSCKSLVLKQNEKLCHKLVSPNIHSQLLKTNILKLPENFHFISNIQFACICFKEIFEQLIYDGRKIIVSVFFVLKTEKKTFRCLKNIKIQAS